MNNKRKEYQRLYRATKRSLNHLHQVQENSDSDDGADTQYGVNGALHVPDKQHTRDIPSDQSDFDDKQQAPHNDGINSDDENNLAWDVIDNLNYVNISSDEEEAEDVSLALDLVKWTNHVAGQHVMGHVTSGQYIQGQWESGCLTGVQSCPGQSTRQWVLL